MKPQVNALQLAVLQWIAAGCPSDEQPTESYKTVAVALQNRRLVETSRKRGGWQASLTETGRHYLGHGAYPAGHFLAKEPKPAVVAAAALPNRREPTPVVPPPPVVDSPARVRARGSKPQGDVLFPEAKDPWDRRVLISVKEAAWLLSVSEHEIRRAVTAQEVQRVFIGQGTMNYRVVYGSLLAWVNDMPREPANHRWWS